MIKCGFSADGEYWRLLTNGDYEIEVDAPGFEPSLKDVTVKNGPMQEAKRLDFELEATSDADNMKKKAADVSIDECFENQLK